MAKKRNVSNNNGDKVAKKRRITDYFEEDTQYKSYKSWQIAEKGQMQNLLSRFPQLFEEICGLLDYQTLVKCTGVNESWYNTITNQRIYWIQMISKFTNSNKECHKQWMKATDKTPFDILKRLAGLARENCKYEPRCQHWHMLQREDENEPELSLFHILVSEGDIELFKYVAIKVGYKHMFGTKKSRWGNKKEYTPLHEAASRGNFDICKFIIDQVEDKNPANKTGHTPFHIAADYKIDSSKVVGHFEICKLIFEATGFQNPTSKYGGTPFHSAASNGNLKICEMIIEKIDHKNPASTSRLDENDTPLHKAAKGGHFEICKLIIEKVVVKNPSNDRGVTPLHCAAENDDLEICKLIVENIGESNPRDNHGNTPLHHAVENSNLEMCKLILQNVVDKNPRNNYGRTPLDLAFEEKDLRILYFLIGENNLQY